jgi:cytochrome P450
MALRSPPGHLVLGHLPELRRDQLGFYTRCAREHGDFVPIRFGPRRAVLVSHPDVIEEVLVAKARHFTKTIALRMLRPVLGDGLLLSDGDLWLRQRRLVQPAFHRARIAAAAEVMVANTERALDRWKDGEPRDIHAEMMALTQGIVAKTLFDAEVGDEAAEVGSALQVLMEDFRTRLRSLVRLPMALPTPANLAARRAIRRLDRIVYEMVERRRQSAQDRGDLLSMLLAARDADDGSRMTDRQVRDEVMTLFLAGHETTATALSWTWELVGRHPAVEARLVQELDQVVGDRAPGLADLPALRYAEWVVTEAMRLYPPAYAVSRETVAPIVIGGHRVEPRTAVLMSQWVVHRDPRFFDDPEAFRPERWADDLARRLPRFAYFPFGGGPRLCIGQAFAMMEAVLILATVARRFGVRPVAARVATPRPSVTLRPDGGIPVIVARRRFGGTGAPR